MQKKRNSIALLMLIATVFSSWAHIIRVPSNAPTIQSALNSLQNGDTILVSLGTYAEALIAPPLSFLLKGDVIPDTGDYPRPLIDPSLLPGSDTLTCLILPEGSHAILEDIAFRNGPQMHPENTDVGGIQLFGSDLILHRVIMDSVVRAVWPQQHDGPTITAESCSFLNCRGYGLGGGGCSINATNCFFSGRATQAACQGLSNFTRCVFTGTDTTSNMLGVLGGNNIIQNCIFGPASHLFYSAIALSPTTGVLVINNIFTNCAGGFGSGIMEINSVAQHGVQVFNNTFIADHGKPAISCNWQTGYGPGNIGLISNNQFIQCSGNWLSNVITLNTGADLNHNRFIEISQNSVPAIYVANGNVQETDSSTRVRNNLFYRTGFALQNQRPTVVDARYNWWGDSTGPYNSGSNPFGLGDTVVGNVVFDPWYIDSLFNLDIDDPFILPPSSFILSSFPNPFNPTTTISFSLSQTARVKLTVYDITGREVQQLLNEQKTAGVYHQEFDGTHLPSGIYFARIEIDSEQIRGSASARTVKMVLLK